MIFVTEYLTDILLSIIMFFISFVILIIMLLETTYAKNYSYNFSFLELLSGKFINYRILILVFGFNLLLTNAQRARLIGFLKPCDNYTTSGYQVCNAFIAMNQGGLNGLGLGNSKQKYNYLVEPHTDSVFAIIAEEQGVIKTTIILIAIFSVVFILYNMSLKITSKLGKYVCYGISWYMFVHLFLNLGGLLGIIPLTGVPLPFFSYGGTFAMCLLCSFALAQRVWIEEKTKRIKV